MGKFLDTYDHPKLNQEDINQLNRSRTHNEIQAAIKSLENKFHPSRLLITNHVRARKNPEFSFLILC
jgi:hypothetical protein